MGTRRKQLLMERRKLEQQLSYQERKFERHKKALLTVFYKYRLVICGSLELALLTILALGWRHKKLRVIGHAMRQIALQGLMFAGSRLKQGLYFALFQSQ